MHHTGGIVSALLAISNTGGVELQHVETTIQRGVD